MTEIRAIHDKAIWEKFLAAAKPRSFLHSWNWGEAEKKLGRAILRLGIYQDRDLIAVGLITKIHARRGSFLFCPHGPIIADEPGPNLDPTRTQQIIASLSEYLRIIGKKEGFDFIRISPLLPDTKENNEIFFKNGFRNAPVHMMHPELAWILDITPPDDALLSGMRKTTRYCIKKAEKDGITISQSSDPGAIEKFWPLYKETVQRQQFAPFSKATLRAEAEALAPDNQLQFFFAHYQGEIVAAALIVFYLNSAFYHHAASSRRFQRLNTTYLLQWRAIQEAKRRQLQWYNFWGVVPDSATHHPWFGLSQFKKGFGGFAEAYSHAKDRPLSAKYWFSYMVETARRKWRRLDYAGRTK